MGLPIANYIVTTLLLSVTYSYAQTEFCSAVPAANLPATAECRPASDDGIPYGIEVVPILGRGYSVQCDVHMVVGGANGETQPIQIATSDKGIIRMQTVTRQDVGAPAQVRLTLKGSPNKKWKCHKIIIRQEFKWWGFDCTGFLGPESATGVYVLSGNKMYSITVQTGNDPEGGTHGAVEINLKGETGQTGSKLLKHSFYPGSQRVVNFRAADVGKLTEIILTNTADDDPWYSTFVDIRAEDGQVAHFSVRRWIGLYVNVDVYTPYTVEACSLCRRPYDKSVPIELEPKHAMDLPPQDIECFTRASDIISGLPDLLQLTKVRCPVNCDNDPFAFVRGSSVHPSTSSICQSAIMDGVIGSSGGELVLTTLGALPEYFEAPNKLSKIEGRDYEPSPDKPTFTYFVYQSYSIDNIEKDVRVVDAYGKLSAVGRLEVRRNGDWGTVCSKGDLGDFNQEAARKACQILGYLHGIYLDSCGFVKGTNVCSGKGYKTAVAAVQCQGNEKTFLDCSFEEPPAMCKDHSIDVAIQCTNFPPDKEPLPGTLRIADASGAPAVIGPGRLEYYLNGWGTVCDDGWTFESEAVACREMGYSGVKGGGMSTKMSGCKDAQGVNLCGKIKQKINAVNMACDGTEKNLRSCAHETGTDIYCVHEEDIVIACEGDGDPSGMGFFTKEEAPDVTIRPFTPLVNLRCSDRPINTKTLSGRPGSMFPVRCPDGCLEDVTGRKSRVVIGCVNDNVKGTYIYTDDSSVCRAAIHAGAIDDSGGDFILVLGYGQRSYMGRLRYEERSAVEMGRTFFKEQTEGVSIQVLAKLTPDPVNIMVSKVLPSTQARVAPESKRASYSHFAGESLLPHVQQGQLSFFQDDVTIDGPIVQPAFSWCPPAGWKGFKAGANDFVDATNLPGSKILSSSKDFTISVRAQVAGGSGTWRTILAHSECDGFSLAINPEDELIFEQVCHPKTVFSGFKPKLDEWFHVLVVFFNADKTAAIFINGKRVVHEVTDYTFNLRASMAIGRSSDLASEYFVGDIACVRVFGFVMNPTQIAAESSIVERPTEACPAGGALRGGGGKSRYTVDGRLCLTSCVPEGVEQQKPHLSEKKVATRPAFEINCEQTLSCVKFDGRTGQTFRVICPPGCAASSASVCGMRIYSSSSSVCRAALHQGLIRDSGGEITVTLQNGISIYDGGLGENNVESQMLNDPQARSFSLSEAQPIRRLSCHDDATFIMKSKVSSHEIVHCPENCAAMLKAAVFGDGSYSPSSSVCRAAIHAGVLTDAGGQVELQVESERKFDGSEQNGILSHPADLYLRAFSFAQTTEVACFPFSLSATGNRPARTPGSFWNQLNLEHAASDQSSFRVQLDDRTRKPIITIKNFSCSSLPKLFLVRDFRCDKFAIDSTIILTNSSTSAGIAFDAEDEHTFFRLEAIVQKPDGSGKWAVEKIVQDERIKAGPEIPFMFPLNIPLNVKVISNGANIQAWANINGGENTMIANVKSFTTSKKIGSVGLSVCQAPAKGVSFSRFEVTPTSTTAKNSDFTTIEQINEVQ